MNSDDFAHLLVKKGATQPCQRCTGTNFHIGGISGIHTLEMPHLAFYKNPYIPMVFVVCTNCGNITMHSKAVLEKD